MNEDDIVHILTVADQSGDNQIDFDEFMGFLSNEKPELSSFLFFFWKPHKERSKHGEGTQLVTVTHFLF